MRLSLINGALNRRLGSNHNLQIINGEPNRIHVCGKPADFAQLQHAIAAVREVEPAAEIDLEPALKHLRSK